MSGSSSCNQKLFTLLCRANRGILQQKLGLFEAISAKYGPAKTKVLYQQQCPIVKASIGQHVRHSLDHIERAANAASDAVSSSLDSMASDDNPDWYEIHYDLRKRGDIDEHDIEAATNRIKRVDAVFDHIQDYNSSSSSDKVVNHPVQACFMLSGDSNEEFMLPSTVARELGFAAHHAIHHMALIRVMATTAGGLIELDDSDLPVDFGRAPSTLNFDNSQQQQ